MVICFIEGPGLAWVGFWTGLEERSVSVCPIVFEVDLADNEKDVWEPWSEDV